MENRDYGFVYIMLPVFVKEVRHNFCVQCEKHPNGVCNGFLYSCQIYLLKTINRLLPDEMICNRVGSMTK